MERDEDTCITTQLQQWDLDGQQTQSEYELMLAAEAHHRLRLLNSNRPRLEDLAEEWIEMLRDSIGKTTD